MSDFVVGSKVQWEDRDTSEVTDGVITAIIPPKKEKPSDWWKYSEEELQEMITYATVSWADGTEDTVDIDDLDIPDSDLEREFRNVACPVLVEIKEKVSKAASFLDQAVALAEKHGIPFDSEVSFLGQSYFPTTFSEMHPDLESDFVESVTGASTEYYGDDNGWERSAVCY